VAGQEQHYAERVRKVAELALGDAIEIVILIELLEEQTGDAMELLALATNVAVASIDTDPDVISSPKAVFGRRGERPKSRRSRLKLPLPLRLGIEPAKPGIAAAMTRRNRSRSCPVAPSNADIGVTFLGSGAGGRTPTRRS
jgi:hypothetical protein